MLSLQSPIAIFRRESEQILQVKSRAGNLRKRENDKSCHAVAFVHLFHRFFAGLERSAAQFGCTEL